MLTISVHCFDGSIEIHTIHGFSLNLFDPFILADEEIELLVRMLD